MAVKDSTRTPARGNGKPNEDTPPPIRSLMQKLLDVATEIPEIDKDGHNNFADYDFASAENILRKVRTPLADQGIVLLASLTDVTERPFKTAKGKDSVLTTVMVTFTLTDSETGEKVEAVWAGTGDDPSDKGLYKAYTGAVKTFLRVTFLLPLGDDPEADSRADERTEGNGATTAATSALVTAEQAANLTKAVEEADLTAHLEMKLRSFGVDSIDKLTVEQGMALWQWSKGGEA
jgi:hypothetical protein